MNEDGHVHVTKMEKKSVLSRVHGLIMKSFLNSVRHFVSRLTL